MSTDINSIAFQQFLLNNLALIRSLGEVKHGISWSFKDTRFKFVLNITVMVENSSSTEATNMVEMPIV